MARDYKNRAAGKHNARAPVAAWIWLLIGFITGGVLVGFLCLKYSPNSAPRAPQVPKIQLQPAAPKAQSKPPVQPKAEPEFSFYDVLGKREVQVPEERPAPKPIPTVKQPPAPPPTPVEADKRYLIQVGSFRNRKDADAMKAQLGLLGLRANIRTAQLKGETWYRVQLGPYAKAQARRTQKQLTGSGHKGLLIPVR